MLTDPLFVSTDWLATQLDAPDIRIIDASWYLPAMARDPEAEYAAGHIPGALRFNLDAVSDRMSPLPHMLPSEADFTKAARALGISDSSRIIIYDGAGLFAAPRVRWTFRVFGARDVRILDGGLPKWHFEGRPLTQEIATPAPGTFTARLDAKAVASRADIARILAENSATVLDARPESRFRGEAPEPRPGLASGHMPGAKNLPATALIENGTLKSLESLRQTLAQFGINPASPSVSTCGSGVTAAIISLALERLGHPPHALYDGSWAEWGEIGAGNPVATGA